MESNCNNTTSSNISDNSKEHEQTSTLQLLEKHEHTSQAEQEMLAQAAKMKVCRHPYDAARTVIQFLQNVLQIICVNADTRNIAHSNNITESEKYKSIASFSAARNTNNYSANTLHHIHAFLNETTGSPTSLAHVGPVSYDAVMSINKHITDNVLADIIMHAFNGEMWSRTTTSSSLMELWGQDEMTNYVRTRLSVRKEHLPKKKFFEEEERYEAGLSLMRALTGQAIDVSCKENTEGIMKNNKTPEEEEQCTVSEEKSEERCKRWRELIDLYTLFLPDRSAIHELENLPQEIAIGEIITNALEKKEFWQEKCCNEHHAEVQHLLSSYNNTSNNNNDDNGVNDNKSNCGIASSTSSIDTTQLNHEEKLHELIFHPTCVVDVGGGNGFLAAMLAERLHCTSLVIDPYFPPHAIDHFPPLWPNTPHRVRPACERTQLLRRVPFFFNDFNWQHHFPSLTDVSGASDGVICVPAEETIVVAKHLCGSAIDNCLRHCEEQEYFPRMLVVVPCCFGKIKIEEYCNRSFLEKVLHIHTQEEFERITRLTDWNASCYREAHERQQAIRRRACHCKFATSYQYEETQEKHGSKETHSDKDDYSKDMASQFGFQEEYLQRLVKEVMQNENNNKNDDSTENCTQSESSEFAHHTKLIQFTQGSKPHRSILSTVACTHTLAMLIESLLNYGRIQYLQEKGYKVKLIEFVPTCVTPKNKCIVAIRECNINNTSKS